MTWKSANFTTDGEDVEMADSFLLLGSIINNKRILQSRNMTQAITQQNKEKAVWKDLQMQQFVSSNKDQNCPDCGPLCVFFMDMKAGQ